MRSIPSKWLLQSLFVFFGCLTFNSLQAQLVPVPTYAGEEYFQMRLLIQDAGRSGIHAAMQPLTYSDLAKLADANDSLGLSSSYDDEADVQMARVRLAQLTEETDASRSVDESNQRFLPWLSRSFYTTRGYALDVQRPGFRLLVNPVLDLRTGRQSNNGGYNFLNTRGLSIRGEVDQRVWFQTTIHENQEGLRSYEEEWRRAYDDRVPGVGFYKTYDPILYDLPRAVDYFQATGEVGFRLTRHISTRLGHGNPQLGLGDRSLILSNFADPFLYAQIDTRVWRFHYRNLYAQLQDGVQTNVRVERKHLVAHTLSIQLTRNWEFGLTEQTVFKRENGFDAQYLNPIILYRAVEQDNGSPDNALIGFHSNVIINGTALLYGQFMFDEFKFDELFLNGDGWWANKYSWQLGLRYINFFNAPGLDVHAEVNYIRPFTYSHRGNGISLTHYSQPLAHPWGASLREFRLGVTQRFAYKWRLSAKLALLKQDEISLPADPNIGANILYNNDLRGEDYGYTIAGTLPVDRTYATAAIAYQPFPGANLEARYEYFGRKPIGASLARQHGVSIGLSLNAIRRQGLF